MLKYASTCTRLTRTSAQIGGHNVGCGALKRRQTQAEAQAETQAEAQTLEQEDNDVELMITVNNKMVR